MAAGVTSTVPFCGSCGFDANGSVNKDVFCDSCGADLNLFGFKDVFPPYDIAAAGGSNMVTFTWTEVPDTSDIRFADTGTTRTLEEDVTSPYVVNVAPGEQVTAAVRIVESGVAGPFTHIVTAVATA